MENYSAINPDLHISVMPMHVVALLLAICSNVSTIVIIIRTPRLHTPSCTLMLALAMSDLVLSLVWNAIPLAVVDSDVRSELPSSWTCTTVGIIWQIAITVLTFLHGVVALDRYFFIVHPLKYQVHMTIKRSLMATGAILLLACAILGFPMLNGNHYVYSVPAMTCVGPAYWYIIYLVLVFLPSLVVTLFSYQRIWIVCVNAVKQDAVGSSRVTIFSPPSCCSSNGNLKLMDIEQSCQARPKLIREDGDFSESAAIKTEVGLPNTTTNLTTSTTIAGTFNLVFPRENVELKGNGWKRDPSLRACPTQTFLDEAPNEQSDKRVMKTQLPSYKTASPVLGMKRVHASHSQSPRPLNKRLWKKGKTGKDGNNALTMDVSARSPGLYNNSEILKSPKVIQWTTIVNPVVLWTLIHELNSIESDTSSSEESSCRDFTLLTLPWNSLGTQLVQQKRTGILPCDRKPRLRTCLMVLLPGLGMMACFLPLIFCLLYWQYGGDSHSDFSVVFCHFCYSLAPPTASLFLSLSNKVYRRALKHRICCCLSHCHDQQL